MTLNSVKIKFKLTDDQMANYPVTTESIWCDVEGDYYRVKNIPQFLDDLSYDDLISIKNESENEFSVEKIIEPSKNSTIWIF